MPIHLFADTSPVIGIPEKDGTRQVSLYQDDGSRKVFSSTKEEVDEYIKVRKDEKEKAGSRSTFATLGLTAIGTLFGLYTAIKGKGSKLWGALSGFVDGSVLSLLSVAGFNWHANKNIEEAGERIFNADMKDEAQKLKTTQL